MKPYPVSQQRLFVCSDLHLRDPDPVILKQRGFTTSEAHDAKILADLQALPRGATLINLGDLIHGHTKWATQLFQDVPHLRWLHVMGNHDDALEGFYREHGMDVLGLRHGAVEVRDTRDGTMKSVGKHQFLGESCLIKVHGQMVWLSHYPHLMWPERWSGGWHLCGHAHRRKTALNPETATDLALDVGVENALMVSTPEKVPTIIGHKLNSAIMPWPTVEKLMAEAAARKAAKAAPKPKAAVAARTTLPYLSVGTDPRATPVHHGIPAEELQPTGRRSLMPQGTR